jgi:hypothetical protein
MAEWIAFVTQTKGACTVLGLVHSFLQSLLMKDLVFFTFLFTLFF